ncbi:MULTISPECIES: DUF2064 domain-containing protein [unclassified Arenibacter]|jgi:glycosyltransferase A (GT-A) superfamily protein (DUF2064 family)|uniref:TIGR04282 family arsenosugar biosynthesis glycosyltransferase n=1 Tax=unclassified Arenibacter TaxID=2615047 RepID=UPI000E3573B3|nr:MULTISPECIES: DUF2064 domain-containing protein [unclassified Arenibacter]MCM4165927.1 DUF2064 domain-containing protein [Arenibacter sp. A80]RFT54436.1 DUF2064 domain-containing protein [Arenibacter sp. P308M17]
MLEHCKIHTTAILIFANSSKEELKYKPMPKGRVLFHGLTEHALKIAGKTGLPYFLISEKEQIGSGFGERFVNAFSSIFKMGFDKVIAIGNDTPQLRASDIVRASGLICAGNAVLGPSMDGGFYLIGLHKCQLDTMALKELPWKSNTLTNTIRALFEASNVHVWQLRALLDLDTHADLKRILKGLKNSAGKIFRLILTLITPVIEIIVQAYISLSLKFKSTYFNKGSPFSFIN